MRQLAAGILITITAAFAQQPSFENARMETRPVGASLESTMRTFIAAQSTPAWIGYSVPIVPGDRHVCGWDNSNRSNSQQQRMSLEGPSTLYVLYRVAQNSVEKVRIAGGNKARERRRLSRIRDRAAQPRICRPCVGCTDQREPARIDPPESGVLVGCGSRPARVRTAH